MGQFESFLFKVSIMLKSCWWVGLWAHKILETAQSPNSLLPFLFDIELVVWTWDLDSGLSIDGDCGSLVPINVCGGIWII